MINGKLVFFAERANWGRAVDLAIGQERRDGTFWVAQPLLFVNDPNEGDSIRQKTCMSMRRDDAQILMDELWNCGLRPSEGTGSAGSLAATERHLKDMQTIAMGLLKGEF